nr:hypothetical protein Iba_chr01cCG8910 [Ipomoea batatas]
MHLNPYYKPYLLLENGSSSSVSSLVTSSCEAAPSWPSSSTRPGDKTGYPLKSLELSLSSSNDQDSIGAVLTDEVCTATGADILSSFDVGIIEDSSKDDGAND